MAYEIEKGPCLKICETLFLNQLSPMLYRILQSKLHAFLEDTSNRLGFACSSSLADYYST